MENKNDIDLKTCLWITLWLTILYCWFVAVHIDRNNDILFFPIITSIVGFWIPQSQQNQQNNNGDVISSGTLPIKNEIKNDDIVINIPNNIQWLKNIIYENEIIEKKNITKNKNVVQS